MEAIENESSYTTSTKQKAELSSRPERIKTMLILDDQKKGEVQIPTLGGCDLITGKHSRQQCDHSAFEFHAPERNPRLFMTVRAREDSSLEVRPGFPESVYSLFAAERTRIRTLFLRQVEILQLPLFVGSSHLWHDARSETVFRG